MKTLFILLILSCCLKNNNAVLDGVAALFQTACCEDVTSLQIPLRKIWKMEETPTDCGVQALRVTSVCGDSFCVDPRSSWAKRLKKIWKLSNNKRIKPPCDRKPGP